MVDPVAFVQSWSSPRSLAADAAEKSRERVLLGRSAVRPIGLLAGAYRRRLAQMVSKMSEGVIREIERAYRHQDDKIEMMAGLAEDAEWHEADHPRDAEGRFAEVPGTPLSQGEREATVEYCMGEAFWLNEALRGGQPLTGKGQSLVREIDSAIQKSTPFSQTEIVYRGFTGLPQDIRVGSLIENRGYSSTTTSEDFARQYLGLRSREAWLGEIEAPAGTRGLDVKHQVVTDPASYTAGEIILPRDTEIRVTEVDAERRIFKGRIVAGPRIAEDASAAVDLDAVIRRLRRTWLRRFDRMADRLADYFATEAMQRTDEQLLRILRRGGMSVRFRLTPRVREQLAAIVRENVGLIRSIPEHYLTQVEGAVMRSVTAGRDEHALVRELRQQYGVTRRRAELISLDQNNKATGAIARARYLDLGIERAIWRHSHAGREPRPTHLANDGREYDVARGWFDPDPRVRKYIRPGELINCRCYSQPVI